MERLSFLSTGSVGASYGVHGFVKVHSNSGDTSHFFKLKHVRLEKDGKVFEADVEKVLMNGKNLLMKFSGISNPEDASIYAGWDIVVPRTEASPLGKGRIYICDLVGMSLIYDNEKKAEVVSVIEGPQAPLLEVLCKDGKKRLVPFMRDIFVSDVDAEKGEMKLLKKELVE